jgi:hypothetical protein
MPRASLDRRDSILHCNLGSVSHPVAVSCRTSCDSHAIKPPCRRTIMPSSTLPPSRPGLAVSLTISGRSCRRIPQVEGSEPAAAAAAAACLPACRWQLSATGRQAVLAAACRDGTSSIGSASTTSSIGSASSASCARRQCHLQGQRGSRGPRLDEREVRLRDSVK